MDKKNLPLLPIEDDEVITISTSDSTHITDALSYIGHSSSTVFIDKPAHYNIDLDTCTICKVPFSPIAIRYNWGNKEELERKVCKVCYCKRMDSLLGLGNKVAAEQALYGEE